MYQEIAGGTDPSATVQSPVRVFARVSGRVIGRIVRAQAVIAASAIMTTIRTAPHVLFVRISVHGLLTPMLNASVLVQEAAVSVKHQVGIA